MTLYTGDEFVEIGNTLYTDSELTEPLTSPYTTSYLISEDGSTLYIMSNVGEILAAIGVPMYIWNRHVSCENSAIVGQFLMSVNAKSTEVLFIYNNPQANELTGLDDGTYVLSPLGDENNSYATVIFGIDVLGVVVTAEYCIPRYAHEFKTNMEDLSDYSGNVVLYTWDEIVVVGTEFYTDETLTTPYEPANPNPAIYSNYLIDNAAESGAEEYYLILSDNIVTEVWTTIPQLTYNTDCALQEQGTSYLALDGTGTVMVGQRAHTEIAIGYTRTSNLGDTYFESNGNVPLTEPGPHTPAGVTLSSLSIVDSVDPNPCYYA
jgi:hypothetical protein